MANDEQHDEPVADDELEQDEQPAAEPEAEPEAAAGDEPPTLEAALEALRDERRARSAAMKESAKHRRQKTELERELEVVRRSGLSEAERLALEAKQAGRDEADLEWRDRYLREAVSAAAGGKLRDPDDAYGLLEATGELGELRELEPDDMRTAARAHVDRLLEKKPYLSADAEPDEQLTGARSTGVRRRMSSTSAESAAGADTSAWLRKAARRTQS